MAAFPRNYTPPRRELPGLLQRLAAGEGPAAQEAEQAILRMGPYVVRPLLQAAGAGADVHRLCGMLGRLRAAWPDRPEAQEARAFLLARLADADARTRRSAARALARVAAPDPEAEEALLCAWARDGDGAERRALCAALGNVGGARALRLLEAVPPDPDDPELTRLHSQAVVKLTRTLGRSTPAGISLERQPETAVQPVPVALHCRAGLEGLLTEELAGLGAAVQGVQVGGPGLVRARLSDPPTRLFAARTFLSFGFPLPDEVLSGDAAEVLVAALSRPLARSLLRTFSEGPPRLRLAWAAGGHRRQVAWRFARLLPERLPGLINDPTGATWTLLSHEAAGRLRLELRPRGDDPRFRYRTGFVAAASHPTLAAALARVAGAAPDDVVWDPFVGSGLELCERARCGPYRALWGTDRDPAAVAEAQKNLAAAGVTAHLAVGEALSVAPPQPTLILTNPPMGRRVRQADGLGPFLDRFLTHAARVLAPGGRLVWISPQPTRTAARAREAGLHASYRQPVDMGGFRAEIQRLEKAPG